MNYLTMSFTQETFNDISLGLYLRKSTQTKNAQKYLQLQISKLQKIVSNSRGIKRNSWNMIVSVEWIFFYLKRGMDAEDES